MHILRIFLNLSNAKDIKKEVLDEAVNFGLRYFSVNDYTLLLRKIH